MGIRFCYIIELRCLCVRYAVLAQRNPDWEKRTGIRSDSIIDKSASHKNGYCGNHV